MTLTETILESPTEFMEKNKLKTARTIFESC